MCRFLLVKASIPIHPAELLQKFATMSQNSKTFDGDWQGDGWGVAWLDEHSQWQVQKSLKPIWEKTALFENFPESRMVVVHARSASFPQYKNVIEFNQPYIAGRYAFVFNGLLKGVRLPSPVEGRIGAQKIWNILQKYLQTLSPPDALLKVKEILITNSREIQALNIGLTDGNHIWGLNHFSRHPEYYRLHLFTSSTLTFLSSEPVEGFASHAASMSLIGAL